MKNSLPKIIAAHDLSGFGKASLTAVMPILSVMGSYVCPLQTAALSSITGVFSGYSFTDLTRHMQDTIKHWKALDIHFDYIYSGFLGCPKQVDIIRNAKEMFGCSLVVDPVFADNGVLYPTMTDDMVSNMKRLVSVADIITPNITEALFLLDESEVFVTKEKIKEYLVRLCEMGPKVSVITSCNFDDGMYVCAYDRLNNEYIFEKCEYYPGSFHGTGDIFTTVVVGAIARGDSLKTAITIAVNFISHAIAVTIECGIDLSQGVAIEKVLGDLL